VEPFLKEQPDNYVLIGDLALVNMGLRDKARIVPERIEHWIDSKQRRSQRHPRSKCAFAAPANRSLSGLIGIDG
jgi:hypothetical protein